MCDAMLPTSSSGFDASQPNSRPSHEAVPAERLYTVQAAPCGEDTLLTAVRTLAVVLSSKQLPYIYTPGAQHLRNAFTAHHGPV